MYITIDACTELSRFRENDPKISNMVVVDTKLQSGMILKEDVIDLRALEMAGVTKIETDNGKVVLYFEVCISLTHISRYRLRLISVCITTSCPCNTMRFFFICKNWKFRWKSFDIFNIFAQTIDCGYTLEQPRRGDSNEYPQSMFWIINKETGIPLYTPVLLNKIGV